jgi:hypothetical protein
MVSPSKEALEQKMLLYTTQEEEDTHSTRHTNKTHEHTMTAHTLSEFADLHLSPVCASPMGGSRRGRVPLHGRREEDEGEGSEGSEGSEDIERGARGGGGDGDGALGQEEAERGKKLAAVGERGAGAERVGREGLADRTSMGRREACLLQGSSRRPQFEQHENPSLLEEASSKARQKINREREALENEKAKVREAWDRLRGERQSMLLKVRARSVRAIVIRRVLVIATATATAIATATATAVATATATATAQQQ